MKVSIAVFILACAVVGNQAQLNLGMDLGLSRGFMGPPPPEFFQDVVLQKEAQKLLTQPDFPEDLRQRVVDTMSNAEVGFNNCKTATTGMMPWMQIRCTMLQLKTSKDELKAIDDEWQARVAQQAATGSTASTAAAI